MRLLAPVLSRKVHGKQDGRMHVREVGGYEQIQRPMHGVEVVALVPQLSAVAIREGHVDLSEENLAQCCAKVLWHVWSVRKLIDAELASRLSSARSLSRGSAERGHAVLCLGIGYLLQVRLVPLPSEHCAHASEDEVVPQNAAEYGCVFRRIESTGRLGFVLRQVRGQRVLELLAVL